MPSCGPPRCDFSCFEEFSSVAVSSSADCAFAPAAMAGFTGACFTLDAPLELDLSVESWTCPAHAVCPKTKRNAIRMRAETPRILLQFFLLITAPFSSGDIQLQA